MNLGRWRRSVGTLLACCLGACRTVPPATAQLPADACQSDPVACVDSVVDAHGGMDLFRRWRFATYVLRDHWDEGARQLAMPWPEGTQDIVLTSDRLGYQMAATLDGTPYRLGVDGLGGWGTGGASGLATVAARYGAGTGFVLALPFRLKDEGTRILGATARIWQGRPVVALDVTFASSTSRTPADRWTLYVDPTSRKMLGCTFLASEYGLNVDVRVEKLLRVGGLWLPSYAVLELAALHLRFHVVEMLQAQLFTQRPASLVDGPAGADRSGEAWHPPTP